MQEAAEERVVWLETALSFATHLLSQIRDMDDKGALSGVTTGPDGDPDKYSIDDLLEMVRGRYPQF